MERLLGRQLTYRVGITFHALPAFAKGAALASARGVIVANEPQAAKQSGAR